MLSGVRTNKFILSAELMESQEQNKKRVNLKMIGFGLLLIVPSIAVIHMGAVMIWGYNAFTTVCWNNFVDYEYDVQEMLNEIFTSVILSPAKELVKLDVEKDILEAAEIGVKHKEIIAIYYSNNSDRINTLFLSANAALYDSAMKKEILAQKEIHPVSSYVPLEYDWQWKSNPIIFDAINMQMTILKKEDHYSAIVIDPNKLKPQLKQIFDNSLANSFINARYLGSREDDKYQTKAFISLYDRDYSEPFFQYGVENSQGWINTRYDEDGLRNFFFGWKIKTEIYAKHNWMQVCAEQFQKFPWRFAIEALLALIFILLLAFLAPNLRRTRPN